MKILSTTSKRVMGFDIYTKVGHGPQVMEQLVLDVFFIECCKIVSSDKSKDINV